ncbi:MAG: hypothetical protein LQ342_005055 [Letrouitia transgressa]|nr:MAG: hypothetical protein LQ342_005055 [Letrouitia transgressa]
MLTMNSSASAVRAHRPGLKLPSIETPTLLTLLSNPGPAATPINRATSSPRRNNRKPCGPHCPDQPHRTCPSPPADADADPKAQRNRTLLTAALATITTAAAANNIYQSAKAHGARKKQVREGEMCSAEEKRLRQRGRLLDVVSLGVAAVGVNNARMGWKRWEASRGSKQGE